jgi:hypothetical protein
MHDMAARCKGTIVPSVSQVAALHSRLLPTAETSVFTTGSISNAGVLAAYAHGNISIQTDESPGSATKPAHGKADSG